MTQLKNNIISFLDEKKCEDIQAVDVSDKNGLFEQMIVATCTSNRHLKSTADGVYRDLKKDHKVSFDGDGTTDWIVVEIDNTLVHLLKSETRELYKLEELWHASPIDHNRE